MSVPASLPDLFIDLHAAATSYTGQGVSVRGYLHYLAQRNVAIRLRDLSPGGGRERFDARFSSLALTALDGRVPGAWIHVGGGGEIAPDVPRYREFTQNAGRAAAYHLWWELSVIRAEVVAELDRFDAILVSSQFLADVARRHLRSPAVLLAPQPLQLAENARVAPDRARFGIPSDAFALLFQFDPSSDSTRKNPWAVLDAYRRAREHVAELHLVAKLMLPRSESSDGIADVETLREAARADAHIHVIDDAFSDADLHALFVSCDAYISLHRAEGLGLGMLEAMHLGVPVVATGYSGNMSFMDERSACLVPYRLVPASETRLPTYQAVRDLNPTWADPDVDRAAECIVRLARNAESRADQGRRGAEAAADWQRQALRFEWLDALTSIARRRMSSAASKPFEMSVTLSMPPRTP